MKFTPSYSLLAAAMMSLFAGATKAQTQPVTPNQPAVGATDQTTVNREVSLQWLRNAGATWAGNTANAGIGRNLSAAGDVNGDGIDDMLVAAYDDGPTAAPGTVYVIFGIDHDLPGVSTLGPSSLTTSSPQRSNGFGPLTGAAHDTPGFAVLQGAQAGDRTGAGLAAAGDVNGDGFDDILVGAPYFDGSAGTNTGAVYLIYGSDNWPETIDLSALIPGQGTVIEGRNDKDRLGASVAGVGDMNGDGTPDIAMGAYNATPPNTSGTFTIIPTRAGQTFVVFGNSSLGDNFSLQGLGSAGMVINGDNAGDQSGRSISSAGDMNADGLGDMIIGARQHDAPGLNGSGAAYVILGSQSLGGRLNLGTLAGNGITILGTDAGDQLGWSVTGGGDLNGDGFDDVAIGAPGYDVSAFGDSNEGRLYMIHGALILPSEVKLSNLNQLSPPLGSGGNFVPAGNNGSSRVGGASLAAMNKPMTGSMVTGADIGARTGEVLAMGGDMNGDNFGDLLIGSAANNDSFVLHGSDAMPNSLNLDELSFRGIVLEGVNSVHALAFVGDMDGDKFDDVAVGDMEALHQRMYGAGTATVVKGAAHMIQASGNLSGGSVFEMIIHGTPNQPWLLMVSPSALEHALFTGRGAWWLGPYFEVLDKTHGDNGETVITVAIPAVAMVNGATVYWQGLEAPTGRHLDLTQLLETTVD